MKIDFVESLAEISKDDWNKIHLNEYPFLKYDFLKSLEDTKCGLKQRMDPSTHYSRR